MRRVRVSFFATLALVASVAACNSLLNFDQFDFSAADSGTAPGNDAGPSDAGDSGANVVESGTPVTDAGGDSGDGAISCTVDLATTCYPCDPASNDQYLNSCTSATCLPFDQTRLTPYLVDGKLPPIPDGGVQ